MLTEALQIEYKKAMRRLASTIAIITSGSDQEQTGMAATAVTSVCADPPTVLVVVNRDASVSPVIKREGHFCVNLLSERHADIVTVFSGKKKGLERFGHGDWVASETGMPVLIDAVASLVCKTASTMEIGTHTIIVGEVISAQSHTTIDPLLWVDGHLARAESVSSVA